MDPNDERDALGIVGAIFGIIACIVIAYVCHIVGWID